MTCIASHAIGTDGPDILVNAEEYSEGGVSSWDSHPMYRDIFHNNVVVAGPGDDIVYGHRGKDTLRGANGNDFLFGGLEDDYLVGGPG